MGSVSRAAHARWGMARRRSRRRRACFPAAKKTSPCTHCRQPTVSAIDANATTPTCMHACIPISYARPDAKTKISWTTRRATSTRALPIPRFHALLLSSVLCFMLGMSQPMPNSSTPNTRHIYRRLHTHRIRSSGLRMWMLLLRSTFSRLILNDLYDDG